MSIDVSQMKAPEPGEIVVLTYPDGHQRAHEQAREGAKEIQKLFGCDVLCMPDILNVGRITQMQLEQLIAAIREIRPE